MKGNLFKQMLNEWKANIWLVLELVIVVLILEVTYSTLYSLYYVHSYTSGARLTDIFVAEINTLHEGNDGYVPYDSVHSSVTDTEMLKARLRDNPYVETVGTGDFNTLPYNYNFSGYQYYYRKPDGGKSHEFMANTRHVSPEIIEILRIRGVNGETSANMADMIRKGYMLLADPEQGADEKAPAAAEFLGKETVSGVDSLKTLHVGAVVNGLRRNDYEITRCGTAYTPLKPENAQTIVLRVKPGMGAGFLNSISDKEFMAGNLFLSEFRSIDNMREHNQLEINQTIRNIVICVLFILLIIFLGFLGTFWFRTQQRVSEIAIRKVNGASNSAIYARFFGEGLILLAVGVALSLPLTIWLIKAEIIQELEMPYTNEIGFWIASAIAILTLALLIVLGIYAPARRAAGIQPAEALKDM